MAIVSGLMAYLDAVRLAGKYRLWPFTAIPVLITAVVAIVLAAAAWYWGDRLAGWLISFYPWQQGRGVAGRVGHILVSLALVWFFVLVLFRYLVLILTFPFMSILSQKLEERIRGKAAPAGRSGGPAAFFRDLARGAGIALALLFHELLLTAPLWLLGLIPLLAPWTAIAILLVQAYYIGCGNMDYTLERYYDIRGSLRFMRAHRGAATANGLGFLFILAIPVAGLVLAPVLATIAATRQTLDLLYDDLPD